VQKQDRAARSACEGLKMSEVKGLVLDRAKRTAARVQPGFDARRSEAVAPIGDQRAKPLGRRHILPAGALRRYRKMGVSNATRYAARTSSGIWMRKGRTTALFIGATPILVWQNERHEGKRGRQFQHVAARIDRWVIVATPRGHTPWMDSRRCCTGSTPVLFDAFRDGIRIH